MSERDNPHDPQDAASSTWNQQGTTNRPADGAARADSLQQVEGSWKSADGATDFLGLDADGAPAPAPADAALTSAASSPTGSTQDWLFSREHASAAEAQASTSVGELEPPAEGVLDENAGFAQTTSVEAGEIPSHATLNDALAEVLPESEEGDPLADVPAPESEVEPDPVITPRRTRRTQWLVAAGLLVCLGSAVGWQLWLRRGSTHEPAPSAPVVANTKGGTKHPGSEHGTTLVQDTRPTTPVPPSPPPRPDPVVGDSGASSPAQGTGTVEPVANPVATSQPTPEPADPAAGAVAIREPAPEPAHAEPGSPLGYSPNSIGSSAPSTALPPVALPKGARRPGAGELASTWSGNTIPFDSIDGERQLCTPRVGAVRVLLKNGEHLQGHLHSVGQGRLSVDIALGRMTIDYRDVHELARIQESDLSKKPSAGLPEETAGLAYVCARVPNGTITGWLVSQDRGKLTLITESAKKVTIDDEGFEPVSKGKARILGALAKNASSPKP